LDLGCGSGNTGAELAANAYRDYTGIDISDVAIEKAKKKAEVDGRTEKNRYFQSDITSYEPTQQFDVILFRESFYYIPGPKMQGTLDRYAKFLKPSGVFIVRLWTSKGKYGGLAEFIEANFEIVGKNVSGPLEAVVLVFRHAGSRQPAASSEAITWNSPTHKVTPAISLESVSGSASKRVRHAK
jgi:SAM-dependent methyltransferase